MKIKTPYDAAYELVCNNITKSNSYLIIDYSINNYGDKAFEKFSFICECEAKKIEKSERVYFRTPSDKVYVIKPIIINLDSDLTKAQAAKFIEEHTKISLES